MKMDGMKIKEFTELLGSDASAPGGGSVAAVEAAFGASLIAMVCALTVKSRKYEEYHELNAEIREKALVMQKRFLELMNEDVESFNVVSAAFGMPKNSDEEKAARSAAIQEGLAGCTKPPFEVLSLASECLGLIPGMEGRSNASAASDLGVAAASLRAAMQGAWLNVKINTDSLKDAELADDYRRRCAEILEKSLPLAESLIHI